MTREKAGVWKEKKRHLRQRKGRKERRRKDRALWAVEHLPVIMVMSALTAVIIRIVLEKFWG